MKSNNNIQSEAVNISIYEMTNNINGKKYFGQTRYAIKKRFKEHCTAKTAVGCAIRKYGPKNFSIKLIIKNIDSQSAANEVETHLIREFNTIANIGHGYNVAEGGYGNPFAGMSEEKKRERGRKISEANKGKPSWNKGKKYKPRTKPNKTRTKPNKTRTKPNKNKGVPRQPRSEEHKQNISKGKGFDLSSFSNEEITLIKELRSEKVSTRKISAMLLETFNRKLSHETIRKYF